MRAFISVDIGDRIGASDVLGKLREIKGIKVVEEENIHLTLKFLGNINTNMIDKIETSMKNSIIGIKKFKLKFIGMGAFPSPKRIRVLWIGTFNGEKLKKIAKNLDLELEKLGFKKEQREFTSHVTLGRVKSFSAGSKIEEIINSNINREFGEIVVESIRLKESLLSAKGPTYKTVREVFLEE